MTEHQIVSILKEAETGIAVNDLCHKYGIAIRLFINSGKIREHENVRCQTLKENVG
ncbi:hypothetical protein [Snodgrassella gandavensis]|uniref:hypothetical protein n=1 Tax=Snodgrassella gandavensis TaxID=2946698 RepID=UPI001EF4D256|nr:hypothetical protein [Snodgrassella gandavensis]